MYRRIRFGHMNVLDLEIVPVAFFMYKVVDVSECLPLPLNDVSCFVFIIFFGPLEKHTRNHTKERKGESKRNTSTFTHMCQSFISFQLNFEMNQIESISFQLASVCMFAVDL